MTNTRNKKLRILVECAMLLAMACVLSLFPKFKFLADGGSITVCSMLPIILISYRRGIKWGLLSGFAFFVFQTITGFVSKSLTLETTMLTLVFDYFLAFTVLGLGGFLRDKMKSRGVELALGGLCVIFLRYLCHVISGYIVFGEYAEWFFSENLGVFGQKILETFSGNTLAMVYSIIYNSLYMAPEMVLTFIVSIIIGKYALRNLGD
ncbi:MAG: energy-coupled thiamine transporter ThiT [Oscillospiraceae bacterium]